MVMLYRPERIGTAFLRGIAARTPTFRPRAARTVQLNTTDSLGRLTLNILLSFAQFERELIAERTRDKMRAARRKGRWLGGQPILGYDVDPERRGLKINAEEARRVCFIFQWVAEGKSAKEVLGLLSTRGWTTKQWISRSGRQHPGRALEES